MMDDARPVTPVEADHDGIPADARAVLRIDLGALRANWSRVKSEAATAECSAVVKADAYGLGLEQVTQALIAEGCRTFFVATLKEGRRVRLVSASAEIFVLDGLLPGAEHFHAGFDLRPVLSSLQEIDDWARFCKSVGRRLPAAIHVDTGINRLGLSAGDVQQLHTDGSSLAAFETVLIVSHLACADDPASPMNEQQRREFNRMRALLPPARASLANSGGIFQGRHYHYDMVRPGFALYGGRAVEGRPNPMKPVVRLTARILQVRDIPAGQTVGYGGIWTVPKPSRIATVACGYADGFLRALGEPGKPTTVGYIGTYPVPVVGRVSMDLLSVDVSSVPEHLSRRGDWVEVMGERVTVDDLTDRAGTIGYELLSRLSRRVHRIYAGAGK
ncbi:MAG: alanine racemase [Lautropia sp.]